MDWEFTDDHDNSWDSDVEYIMTEHGLERTGKSSFKEDEKDDKENNNALPDSSQNKKNNPKGEYRYHKPKTSASAAVTVPEEISPVENGDLKSSATIVLLTRLS